MFSKRKGFTIWRKTLLFRYPVIDIENQYMEANVFFKNKKYLTIHVDVKRNLECMEGNLMKLNNRLKKDHQMTEAELKDIKRHNAKYLLKNKLNHTETD
ncbi:hypothetical protein SAMN05216179_0066 [Gracilibacillus kekensis]|uniref:Uncharacterized protein n=1 Tax=Gracilibacillus kekensis TaxID=1027249 RepID=A0A1M7IIP9_9BACI|nr:hypothetical protein SAMN05216179_0066 [Gracilibacillus kekensis]